MEDQLLIKILKLVIPSIVFFLLGALVNHYFDLFKKRVSKLYYEINKYFLGASAEDNYFGNVQLLYNNAPVGNLYLCNISLVNTSNKDFNNVEITVWCDVESIILVSHAGKTNSIQPLQYSPKFQEKLQDAQDPTIWSRRIYIIPVLNRDDSVTFSCLITNPQGKEPYIYLNCEHQGLRIKPRFYKPNLFWGERQDVSAFWGLVASGFLLIPTVYLIPSMFWLAIASFLLGVIFIVPGILLLKLRRIIRKCFR